MLELEQITKLSKMKTKTISTDMFAINFECCD